MKYDIKVKTEELKNDKWETVGEETLTIESDIAVSQMDKATAKRILEIEFFEPWNKRLKGGDGTRRIAKVISVMKQENASDNDQEEPTKYEVECNDCTWKGDESDLFDSEEGESQECPECGSENLYFL